MKQSGGGLLIFLVILGSGPPDVKKQQGTNQYLNFLNLIFYLFCVYIGEWGVPIGEWGVPIGEWGVPVLK